MPLDGPDKLQTHPKWTFKLPKKILESLEEFKDNSQKKFGGGGKPAPPPARNEDFWKHLSWAEV